jgi:hypothetical protein
MRAHLTNIHDLKTYFDKLNNSRWNLYTGMYEGNLPQGNILYRQDNKDMDSTESWELLNQLIDMNSVNGGDFTVYFPANANGNMGNRIKISIGNNHRFGQHANVGATPPFGMVSKNEVAEMISTQKIIWDLERKVDELESANAPSIGAVIMEQLAGNPETIRTITAALTTLLQVVAARMAGIPMRPQSAPAINGHPNTNNSTEISYSEDEKEGVNNVLGRIAAHFPDLTGFLEKLAHFIETNPDMAKSLFEKI